MKKLFTLIAAALLAVGVNAQTTDDIDVSSLAGWAWHANVTTESGVATITLTEDYGQASTGWDAGTDWSAYNKLCVVIDSYTNDWGKIYFKSVADATIAEQTFGTITEATTVTVEFNPSDAKSVKQLAIQGKAKDDVIKVSRVYLLNEAGDPNLLWEGNHTVNWDNTVKISAAKAANLKVGDIVKFTISNATSGNQAMVKFGWGGNDIVLGSSKGYFSSDDTEFLLGVTESVLTQAKTTGFFLTGTGFTVTKAERVEGSGHEKSIWFGSFVLNDAHSGVEFYCPSETGTATQLVISLEGEGEWFQMKNGSWQDLTAIPAVIKTSTGKQYKFLLTDEIKGVLNSFVLQGKGYTITSLDLDSPADTWTVAGSSAILGSSWDINDAANANAMTSTDGITYTLVKEGVTLEKNQEYEYKVLLNHSWDNSNYGNGSENAKLTVAETAKYKVTFTFDALKKEITATAVKTGEAGPIEHTWAVSGSFTGDTEEGWKVLYEMTKGADGKYTVSIPVANAGDYEFKVRADGKWDSAYPDQNYKINIPTAGSTLVVTFDPETHEITTTVTPPTGIEALTIDTDANAPMYNLAGQRVDKDYKGVVIKNGRKVVVK